MDKKKIQKRIKEKTEAIAHFGKALKEYKDRKIAPPENRPDIKTEEEIDLWYQVNIKSLEVKIAYEKSDLEQLKAELKS